MLLVCVPLLYFCPELMSIIKQVCIFSAKGKFMGQIKYTLAQIHTILLRIHRRYFTATFRLLFGTAAATYEMIQCQTAVTCTTRLLYTQDGTKSMCLAVMKYLSRDSNKSKHKSQNVRSKAENVMSYALFAPDNNFEIYLRKCDQFIQTMLI